MPRNLDTNLFRTFVTVADNGSMTVAAKALHMSQGAVSQHIKRLESVLGCDLFDREPTGLRLTSGGERLLHKARALLSVNDEIWADMTSEPVAGKVRLGVPYDLIATRLQPILKSYSNAYPQVELFLTCGSSPALAQALAAGAIDLAIIEEPLGPGAGERLDVERLVWVGAKAGTAHLRRPLPVSMVSDTCVFRPVVLDALQKRELTWKTVFENGSIEATAATVRTDLAVTAWLVSTVPADLDILPVNSGLPELPEFAINLHLPRHAASAATLALASHIRSTMAR